MASWHIALIEPQAERLAASALRARDYEVYYPSFPKEIHKSYGHTRTVMRPMFPGYMFVNQHYQGWGRLKDAPGIRVSHSLLMINGNYAVVPSIEFQRMLYAEQALCHQIVEANKPHKYEVGEIVRIKDGGLAQFIAEIETLDDDGRIGLLMSIFGRSSRIHTTAAHLEPT